VHRLRLLLERRGHEFGDWPAAAVHFAVGDAVMAGQNMLVAAEMLGYAGCWIGGVLSALETIVERCGLPEGVFPFAGLTLGVPDEAPPQRPRLDPGLVVHTDRYREPEPKELDAALERMAPITSRGDWAASLARYFAAGGTMEARDKALRRVLASQGFGHVAPDLDSLVERALGAGYPRCSSGAAMGPSRPGPTGPTGPTGGRARRRAPPSRPPCGRPRRMTNLDLATCITET
jgi:hypothetical protein